MANLNLVQFIGRLSSGVELRTTSSGVAVARFGIAVNRRWKGSDGKAKEDVLFVDVEAWKNTAETINKYFAKGDPIYVQGHLRLERWEDKNTKEKRSRHVAVLEKFEFLKAADKKPGAPAGPQAADAPSDEDVPF